MPMSSFVLSNLWTNEYNFMYEYQCFGMKSQVLRLETSRCSCQLTIVRSLYHGERCPIIYQWMGNIILNVSALVLNVKYQSTSN